MMLFALFAQSTVNFTPVTDLLAGAVYLGIAILAVWGAYCCITVWRRIGQLHFKSEDEQDAFLDAIQESFQKGEISDIEEVCSDDIRAVPQMTLLAMNHRQKTPTRLKMILVERFQRDILFELDMNLSWVQTIIKAAPMVGLMGTVVGMMSAFGNLSAASEVSADRLASDIMFALVTTAMGLSIAIPLVLASASISNRIGRLEDYAGSGMTRILSIIKGEAKEST